MQSRRFFYGWTIVGVSFVTLAACFGIWYSFSVFFVAVLEEFGWSRAATAGVFSLFVISHSSFGVVIGSLLDRLGPRKVIPFGAVLIAIGLLLSSRVTALWQLYLAYGVLTAAGICSIGFIAQSILLPNWFFRKRGLALGVAMAGIGVGMQVLVPLTQYVISHFGWRTAYMAHAAALLLVVVPLNAVFQRRNPAEIGELPDGEPQEQGSKTKGSEDARINARAPSAGGPWTLKGSLKTSRFWLLFVTFLFIPMAIQGILIHQVAYVMDQGFSAQKGAVFFGLAGIMGSVGKVVFGYLSDRTGREKALTLGMSCAFAGVLSLMALRPGRASVLYGYAILFGLGYGSIAPIFPSRAADLFQGPHFGKIYGFLALAGGLGGATGTWLSGRIFDLTGSYQPAFLGVLAIFILVVVLFWFTAPPAPPDRKLKGMKCA